MIAGLLEGSKRPLIVAGNGIRLSGEQARFWAAVDAWGIPFVATWTGADLIPTAHPLNTGILGMCGQAGANKAVQECDFLLAIGTHLGITHTTTLTDWFAPLAKIAVVNIDADQLDNMTVRVDVPICSSIGAWLDSMPEAKRKVGIEPWLARCADLKRMNEVGDQPASIGINSYVFNDLMTRMLPPGTCMVIDGGGTALYTGFQSSHIKEGSRLICDTGMGAMGSGLPQAVGACLANDRSLTTCLIGDGSLMLNIQELQTIAHHRLPIKIFVLNNGGYLAIRHTQDAFLDGKRFGVGSSRENDISWPHVEDMAHAFDIAYMRVFERRAVELVISAALSRSGPVLCEVICPPNQAMRWKQGFKRDGDKFIPQTLDTMEESGCAN
ncbi:MAG: thiamine pyrophosphate-binding protein [Burkholderiales bacterium]